MGMSGSFFQLKKYRDKLFIISSLIQYQQSLFIVFKVRFV